MSGQSFLGRVATVVRERGGLAGRVAALERDVEEIRRLNVRVAELTDLVAEVLVSPELRDESALRASLERYLEEH